MWVVVVSNIFNLNIFNLEGFINKFASLGLNPSFLSVGKIIF